MLSLTCAAVALTLDDISKAAAYDELTSSERAVIVQEDSHTVTEAFAAVSLPALAFEPAEPLRPFDRPLDPGLMNADLSTLVAVRQRHETDRARKGIRTRMDDRDHDRPEGDDSAGNRTESARQALIRNIQQVMREEQDRAVGTGIERDARWRTHVTAASKVGESIETGNAANAALAAGARAATVTKRRLKFFQEQKTPSHQDLADALVGSNMASPRHAPLAVGSYTLILHNAQLFIGQVLAIYVRSGGKAGFHASQQEVKSIGLVSYVVVQTYEHAFNRRFRAVHQDLANLQTFRFLHISADNLILRLPAECTLSADRRTLEIDTSGYNIFTRLTRPAALPGLIEAVRLLANARRRARQPDEGDGA
ncbi:hypothetical protein TRAPUB_9876 [Trametes pubescens]|uniref:Uncharacterized protein n=1 Tax=Trametes pubescens TaxID=154538 RepID=A0A1M2W138_TRAPU|nr:hypothetical protein TRAPUB_9876 [Trametes pubescens]